MKAKRILVTGGSGFIGFNLTRRLVELGVDVHCLVRQQSKIDKLTSLGVSLVYGDLNGDQQSLERAVDGCDLVIHLAGTTNLPSRRIKLLVNVEGTRNLLNACATRTSPPSFVFISSLAAAGPSSRTHPLDETAACRPVSDYGRSKLMAEGVANEFADRIPISIIRPPIVLGPYDQDGRLLFRMIDRSGVHFIAGYSTHFFSVIQVDDLVASILMIAERGKRITVTQPQQGIYYSAADEMPSYWELGQMIGRALGRKRVWCIPTPKFSILATGLLNSTINRFFGGKNFLNFDKAREAVAGSWTCSNVKLKQLGWQPQTSLQQRLQETAEWYRQHQWL